MSDYLEYLKNKFRPHKGTYEHNTPYPYGKFQKTPMIEVPTKYLLAVYDRKLCSV